MVGSPLVVEVLLYIGLADEIAEDLVRAGLLEVQRHGMLAAQPVQRRD